MELETRRSLHRLVGILMIVITIPALVLFITRDQITSWSVGSANSYDVLPLPTTEDGNQLTSLGAGSCVWMDGILQVVGSGLTSCRIAVWDNETTLNQRLSSDIQGLDQGATAIFRFRESANDRIEIAVGRSQVVIREKIGNQWTLLATYDRQHDRSLMTGSPRSGVPSGVEIVVVSDTVSVDLNGQAFPRVKTQLVEEGMRSIAVANTGNVAVQFDSLTVNDAGR